MQVGLDQQCVLLTHRTMMMTLWPWCLGTSTSTNWPLMETAVWWVVVCEQLHTDLHATLFIYMLVVCLAIGHCQQKSVSANACCSLPMNKDLAKYLILVYKFLRNYSVKAETNMRYCKNLLFVRICKPKLSLINQKYCSEKLVRCLT